MTFRPGSVPDYFVTVSFPVVFSDGEREIDIGDINIYPALDFRKFQSVISQKIGISPYQISVSLICKKKSRSTGNRRIQINEKVNFGSILLEKDCYFLAILKRSRREKRGKPRQNVEENEYFTSSPLEILQKKLSISPPEKMLLRRNLGVKSSESGFVSPFYGQITSPDSFYTEGSGFLDYENQIRNLQTQRENHLMLSTNSYPNTNIEDEYVLVDAISEDNNNNMVCEECSGAKGKSIPFHFCVHDQITVGFRSPVGPIARPSKEKDLLRAYSTRSKEYRILLVY